MREKSKSLHVVITFFLVLSSLWQVFSVDNNNVALATAAWKLVSANGDTTRLNIQYGDDSDLQFNMTAGDKGGKFYHPGTALGIGGSTVSENATEWEIVGSNFSPKLWMIVGDYGAAGKSPKVLNICITQSDYDAHNIDLDGSYEMRMDRNYDVTFGMGYTGGQFTIYRCYGDGADGPSNTSSNYAQATLPSFYSGSNLTKVMNAIKAIRAGTTGITAFTRASEPSAANLDACRTELLPGPLLASNPSATITKIKDEALSKTSIPEAQSAIREYFEGDGIVDSLKTMDAQAYHQFYSVHDNAPYPDILLSDNTCNLYYGDLDKATLQRPVGVALSGWESYVSAGITIVGATAYGGVAATAFGPVGGVAVGGAIAGFLNSLQNEQMTEGEIDDLKKTLPLISQVYFDNFYMQANNKFNACLKSKNDPYAFVNDDCAKASSSNTTKAVENVGTQAGGGALDAYGCPKPSTFDIGGSIKTAFCDLGQMLKNFADGLMNSATNTLQAVLGST